MTAKRYASKATQAKRDARGFAELIVLVPTDAFVRMAGKSGLLPLEARKLCEAFKELKNDNSKGR